MRLLTVTVVALLSGIVACDTAGDVLSPREVRELVTARARWNGSEVRQAYTFETRRSCFCPPEITQWRRVRVVNNVVTEVRDLNGALVPQQQWEWYLTIDQHFEILLREPDPNAADLTAAYDPQFGYPREINLIGKPNIADYGVVWYARALQPVPVP